SVNFKKRFPSYRTECPVHCRPILVAVVPKEQGFYVAHRTRSSDYLCTETIKLWRVRNDWCSVRGCFAWCITHQGDTPMKKLYEAPTLVKAAQLADITA